MENKVYIVKCDDYAHADIKIHELLSLMGGIDQYIGNDEKIVIKPNLLMAADPEKHATTHPAVLSAVASCVKQKSQNIEIIDSPGSGFPHSKKTFEKVYTKCGIYTAAIKAGVSVSTDESFEVVSFPQGKLIKRFEIISPVLHADAIINVCKLKTHGFMSMTGAVKNCFGVIPGLTKPGYHAKLQSKGLFAQMLLDLSEYVSPRLSIMDAIIGMEGEGPNAGTPRFAGYLLASVNPLALDVIASEIMGLDRQDNPVLLEAEKRNIGPTRLHEVELVGAEKSGIRINDYKLPSTILNKSGSKLLKVIGPLIKNSFTVRPHIITEKCTACGCCRDACPVHVITIKDKAAVIDRENCIRCYCCHEMCPHEAIDLQGSLMYRLLNKTA